MSTAPRHLRRRGQNAARLMIVAGLLALLIGPSARAQSTRGTKGKVPAAACSAMIGIRYHRQKNPAAGNLLPEETCCRMRREMMIGQKDQR